MRTIKKDKGFTLVELAIVMIIIGLLIGGVLKGQQLIENAKVTATIAQVKGFQAALNSFRDAYGATAGDMANADTRLSGCDTGNSNNCEAGDGNSLITEDGGDGSDWTVWADSTISASSMESNQFWKHLALADLITGVDPTADPADPAWGETHPASALRGGYEFFHDCCTTLGASGHFLRMSNQGLENSGNVVGQNGAAPATALQAANIDRKMDDGVPNRGTVTANYGTNGAADCHDGTNTAAGEYFEQLESKDCALFFLIDG